MKMGNTKLAIFFLTLAHIIPPLCYLTTPLLIHFGINPAVLPFDPGPFAIPIWFVYIAIGFIFIITGKETKIKVKTKAKTIELQSEPEPQTTTITATRHDIRPQTRDLSISKKEIQPMIINNKIIPKRRVYNLEKRVDDILLSVDQKTVSTQKKDDLSILRKNITRNNITPKSIHPSDAELQKTRKPADLVPKASFSQQYEKNISHADIKEHVIQKKDVSDIKKHVDEILLSPDNEVIIPAMKQDVIPNPIITPPVKDISSTIIIKENASELKTEPHEKPAALKTESNIIYIELEKMRRDIAERKKRQEQLAKEVEGIESQ